jgi:hypothetical protein
MSSISKIFALILLSLLSCKRSDSPSLVTAPGDEKTATDKALNAGADILQPKSPLSTFNTYLNGFHFYNGNMKAQMEAQHYVSQLNNDLYQAIIFDGTGPDAKIMGIEYIITAQLFEKLDDEEKKLWHSHHHEVKSGTLIAPGIPDGVEHTLMAKLVSTYGKTIHTWHTDQDRELPVGSPMLMMGATKDGQIYAHLINERDKRIGVSTEDKRKNREDIKTPPIIPGANAWEVGEVRQFLITNKADSARMKHQIK